MSLSELRRKLFNLWIKKKTKNLTQIPLFVMHFDYKKFKAEGKRNSCMLHIHPELAEDKFIKSKLQEVVDYVRDNYDMDIFTRI